MTAVRELFHVGYWLAHSYARNGRPEPGLTFDQKMLPSAPLREHGRSVSGVEPQTIDQLQRLETELRSRDEKLTALLADKAIDIELQRLRAEVAEAKKAASARPDTHDYSETETRDYFIDLLLKEAGWPLDQERDREYPVTGMPNNQGKGFVNYVLWGDETSVDLPGFTSSGDFEKFRSKARLFLREHLDHITIHKLRMNRALTAIDLAELERILEQSGVGGAEELARAKEESHGLGLFVRSLVGLDREAAKESLAGFLTGKTLGGNQIEFVDLIVNHLTEHGVMAAALLYESPFTDITPQGPDGFVYLVADR